jgi:hypothetical protein
MTSVRQTGGVLQRMYGNSAHRVPYLKLDLFRVNIDHSRAELHADSQVVYRLEPLVGKLQQQARLADTCRGRITIS